MKKYFILLQIFIFFGCKSQTLVSNKQKQNYNLKVNDTTFVQLKKYSKNFIYDLKYATNNNFLKTKVYDCDECYLRYKTVKQLIEVNKIFKKKGVQIKLFDCYRPLDIQKKMWALVPNTNFVANPAKGSVHNRGCAVDLTLVDLKGIPLDMGTEFDFFGEAASHSYTNLSEKILTNRKLLKQVMLSNGFKSIDSEWWHYNLIDGMTDKVSNFKWKCD